MAVSGSQLTRIGIGPAVGIAVTIVAKASGATVISTRYTIIGTSQERLTLVGTSQERLTLVGTSQERLTIIGSSG